MWQLVIATIAAWSRWAAEPAVEGFQQIGHFVINTTTAFSDSLLPILGGGDHSSVIYWSTVNHCEQFPLDCVLPKKEITHITVNVIEAVDIPISKPAQLPLNSPLSEYHLPAYPTPYPTSCETVQSPKPSVSFALTNDSLADSRVRQTSQYDPKVLLRSGYYSYRQAKRFRSARSFGQSSKLLVFANALDSFVTFSSELPHLFLGIVGILCIIFAARIRNAATYELIQGLEAKITDAHKIIENLKLESVRSQKRNDSLLRHLMASEAKRERETRRANGVEGLFKALKTRTIKTKKATDSLNILAIWRKDNEMEQLRSENAVHSSTIRDQKDLLDKKATTNTALQEQVSKLKATKESQQKSIHGYVETEKTLDPGTSSIISDLKAQLKMEQDANSTNRALITKLKSDKAGLGTKIKQHEATIKQKDEVIREQGRTNRKAGEDAAQLKREREEFRRQVQDQATLVAKHDETIAKKDVTVAELTEKLTTAKTTVTSHNTVLNTKNSIISTLETSLSGETTETRRLREQLSKIEIKIQTMQTTSSEEKKKFQRLVETQAETIKTQADTIEETNATVSQLEVRKKNLEQSLAKVKAEACDNKVEATRHEATVDVKEQEIRDMARQKTEAETKLGKMVVGWDEATQKNHQLKRNLMALKAEAETKEQEELEAGIEAEDNEKDADLLQNNQEYDELEATLSGDETAVEEAYQGAEDNQAEQKVVEPDVESSREETALVDAQQDIEDSTTASFDQSYPSPEEFDAELEKLRREVEESDLSLDALDLAGSTGSYSPSYSSFEYAQPEDEDAEEENETTEEVSETDEVEQDDTTVEGEQQYEASELSPQTVQDHDLYGKPYELQSITATLEEERETNELVTQSVEDFDPFGEEGELNTSPIINLPNPSVPYIPSGPRNKRNLSIPPTRPVELEATYIQGSSQYGLVKPVEKHLNHGRSKAIKLDRVYVKHLGPVEFEVKMGAMEEAVVKRVQREKQRRVLFVGGPVLKFGRELIEGEFWWRGMGDWEWP